MHQLFTLYLISAVILTLPVAITGAVNLCAFRKPRAIVAREDELPFISILVPARDEEAVIEKCIASLLAQNYPAFEVIVLDDNSSDATYEILCRLRDRDHRLRVLAGALLPDGWCGKPHACWQLAKAASGDYLLFTDADCIFTPDALLMAVGAMVEHRADLVSLSPDYLAHSFWERLIVPQLLYIPLFFAPMPLVNGPGFPLVAGANGAFLFLSRETYFAVDGHRAVKDQLAEDVKFAQHLKRFGKRLWYGDGIHAYSVRMYETLAQIWTGFTRNLFPAFSNKEIYLLPALVFLVVVFILPLPLALYGAWTAAQWTTLAAVPYITILALRLAIAASLKRGYPWYAPLDPLAWAATVVIAVGSIVKTRRSGAHWKGRAYINGRAQPHDR